LYIQNKLLAQGIRVSAGFTSDYFIQPTLSNIYTEELEQCVPNKAGKKFEIHWLSNSKWASTFHFSLACAGLIGTKHSIWWPIWQSEDEGKLDFELVHAFNSMFCSLSTCIPLGNQIWFFSCLA